MANPNRVSQHRLHNQHSNANDRFPLHLLPMGASRVICTRGNRKRSLKSDLQRKERAMELLGGIIKISKGQWSVQSGEKLYSIKNRRLDTVLNHFTCTCKDFQHWKRWCKHILAVTIYHHRQENPIEPVTIDLTEDDDDAAVEPEIDLSEDGAAASETEINLTEDGTAVESVIDLTGPDTLTTSTTEPEIAVARRLDRIRSRLSGIQYLEEAPLLLIEMAVARALRHAKNQGTVTDISEWTDVDEADL